MHDSEEISNKQIAHEIAVNYAVDCLRANPQELPNIAHLYLDTYRSVLEQLQPKNLLASAPPRVQLKNRTLLH